METVIKNSENNTEKYATYRAMTGRHKLAMKHGFYLEAMLIDYAMLEDRLTSFIWYAGVIKNTNSRSLGGRANKQVLNEIFGEENLPNFRNISGKIDAVRTLISFAFKPCDKEDKYAKLLHEALNTIDLDELSQALDGVDKWREYRNEVIHAAMKKNIISLYEDLEKNAGLGMEYARVIDNAVRRLKKRPAIRRSVRMPSKKDG